MVDLPPRLLTNFAKFAACAGASCFRSISRKSLLLGAVALCHLFASVPVTAQPAQPGPQKLSHGFEEAPAIGIPGSANLAKALVQQSITSEHAYEGVGAERLLFQTPSQPPDESRIVIPAPQSRVFNELSASMWVRTNCSSVRLGLRIRFPRQIDPRTNAPLEVDFFGTPYTETKQWQRLTVETTEELVQSRMIRVRSQLADGLKPVRLDEREAYVDQIILQFQLPAGTSAILYDNLEYGPVVRPENVVADSQQSREMTSKLTIENDRIRKNGQPFFPIMTLYHAEPLEQVARTGANMLWIRNYDDRPLLSALEDMDIGAMASPPQSPPAEAILNRSAIPTMPEWTSPIWAWMMGINLPASDRPYVTAWADQVRDADRQIHRPIIADVAADERDFHRKTDLISITRCQLNTSHSSLDHFQTLLGRSAHALPGKPRMTFVQTEASGALLDYFADRTNLPIVEPEQILHQGFEAIAAGFKGVGFWKQIPFDTDAPGLNERLHAIRIFSIQARLLEPFVATGRITEEVAVQVDPPRQQQRKGSSSPLATRWDRPLNEKGKATPAPGESAEIRATVFHTDRGLLVLLVWHEPGAQCVPGPQIASNVRVLIRGIGDIATACEVTPTSVGQSNLAMDRVSGGTELTLKKFDQYAAIIVTPTPDDAKSMQKLAWQSRQAAAESYVSLAKSKLSRVRIVQSQLEAMGTPSVPNAQNTLTQAELFLADAESSLAADRADETRIAAQNCLQQLRLLQRQHWELAVAPLSGPTATMEATSFQTLPDHWKLMRQLGDRVEGGENLLPSGSFDDENTLASGDQDRQELSWSAGAKENRFTSLRLVRSTTSSESYLSMIVKPDAPPGETSILVSPQMEVNAGDLVIVTGEMHLRYPLNGPEHHFEIFDTIAGREGALVFKEKTEQWTPFRLIRRAPQSGPFRVRFELKGPGIAEVDNIRVEVVPAGPVQQAGRFSN